MIVDEVHNDHSECDGGVCGECKGDGEVDCACPTCGDEHQTECQHCEGSGECWFGVSDDEVAQREWADIVEAMVPEAVSLERFIVVYGQMFGRPPSLDVQRVWRRSVEEAARRARINLKGADMDAS